VDSVAQYLVEYLNKALEHIEWTYPNHSMKSRAEILGSSQYNTAMSVY